MYCVNHKDREGKGYCSKYNRYLCEECMKCQDPGLYCKFRKACVVWERDRHGRSLDEPAKPKPSAPPPEAHPPAEVKVEFEDGKTALVPRGSTIYEASQKAKAFINATCGGRGACGKCKVIVKEGDVVRDPAYDYHLSEEEKNNGWVLACQTTVESDIKVEVPDAAITQWLRITDAGKGMMEEIVGEAYISPMVETIPVEMPPPTLDDPVSDYRRLIRELVRLKKDPKNITCYLDVLRYLSARLREGDWKVTVALGQRGAQREILWVRPGTTARYPLGMAIDVGTTSIVVSLVDLLDGRVLAMSSRLNAQVSCGDDVISRIIYASKKGGLERLHSLGVNTINEVINEVCTAAREDPRDVVSVVVAGNTVMTHLLLKLDPSNIRKEPYIPTASTYPIIDAGDIGLAVHPRAGVFVMPCVAAYVGGDITAGVIHSGMHKDSRVTLLIDVGTNGEMVLGNKDWLVTASCSTGPAFEGGGLKHGMRAVPGAIDQVEIHPQTGIPRYHTIAEDPTRGICGSGVISALAELFSKGFLAPNGKLKEGTSERIRRNEVGLEYVIAKAEECDLCKEVVLTEDDIQTLIQSKGAVFAGIESLLKNVGMTLDGIDRILIAGGFGAHLNINHCITIGMLPDIDRSKFEYIGNSSLKGAYRALLFEEAREEALKVSESMTYIDFSSNDIFFQEYQSALFLPHTHDYLFPSIKAENKK